MTMRIRAIKETCLYITDLDGAENFYSNVLEFNVFSKSKGHHVFFKIGQSMLLLFNPDSSRLKLHPPAHYGGGKQHLAFEVKAGIYNQTKEQLISKGINITDTMVWKNGMESFYFEDPFGNVLEIVPEGIWG